MRDAVPNGPETKKCCHITVFSIFFYAQKERRRSRRLASQQNRIKILPTSLKINLFADIRCFSFRVRSYEEANVTRNQHYLTFISKT